MDTWRVPDLWLVSPGEAWVSRTVEEEEVEGLGCLETEALQDELEMKGL